jgi:hypothetical protein
MIKQPAFLWILAFLVAFSMGSCTSANKEELTPGGCDTTNMSYSTNIVPILQNNCYSCHGIGNSVGSGGIVLEGYNNLQPWADTTRVKETTLEGVISHHPGYVPMPYMKPQMDSCSINQIVAWIKQGFNNN